MATILDDSPTSNNIGEGWQDNYDVPSNVEIKDEGGEEDPLTGPIGPCRTESPTSDVHVGSREASCVDENKTAAPIEENAAEEDGKCEGNHGHFTHHMSSQDAACACDHQSSTDDKDEVVSLLEEDSLHEDGEPSNIKVEDEGGEEDPSTGPIEPCRTDLPTSDVHVSSQEAARADENKTAAPIEENVAEEGGKCEGNDGHFTHHTHVSPQKKAGAGDHHSPTDGENEVASLSEEDAVHEDRDREENNGHETKHQEFEIADFVEDEIRGVDSSDGPISTIFPSSTLPTTAAMDRVTSRQRNSLHYSTIFQSAKVLNEAKNDRLARRLQEQSENNSNADTATTKQLLPSPQKQQKTNETTAKALKKTSFSSFSLDEDVANVDRILIQTSYAVIICWVSLVFLSYTVVPPGSIERYEGTERSAALVELSILSTAVIMKHFPLLWDMNFMDMGVLLSSDRRGGTRRRKTMVGRTHVSGILAGGMVTQFIAVMTAAIMVFFPVPVMIDPILGSRVHFIRWCEWIPLAGYMTLLTECIDAPQFDGTSLTHPWRTQFTVAALESISTSCGLLFPFCRNLFVWLVVMIFSVVTYSAIIFRYFEKRRLFETCVWRGGGSVDEVELYDRARVSLSLHGVCCVVWTLITLNYFLSSLGPLIIPERHVPALHDPAAIMVGECFMDLLAKCLYMALVVEAHQASFDEARRANRRLTELRETMSVVWENSSDTIAISVRKISGSVTSMVSPSFFRPALATEEREGGVEDISAIVLEHDDVAMKKTRGSTTDVSQIKEGELPNVGMKIIRKADFAQVDLHSAESSTTAEYLRGRKKNEAMTPLVVAFTDMLARAWQGQPEVGEDFLFEHDTYALGDGAGNGGESSRTKFEVKATRLEENAVVVVVRNVSERHRRFEAEKRFVFETTARQKDAEANRFTRHEVKNGLLAAIEICDNLREQLAGDFGALRRTIGCANKGDDDVAVAGEGAAGHTENMAELDRTLHEVLDIVLAETMARDVIHEMYVPRMERMDVNHILTQTRGFKAISGQVSVTCKPSPLPILLSDQGLFKCIHGNAIRNALKYGERSGKISTEATYSPESGELEVKVINLPGPGHEKLVSMGCRAGELVFSNGTRLHKDSDVGRRSHSAGDGAWIIRKCANILGGTVGILFEETRTVFTFRAPMKVHRTSSRGVDTFHLPRGVWGVAIDDSKIQRKLLRRFFHHAGVLEERQVILGQRTEEIAGFVELVVDFVARRPSDRFILIADENLEMDHDDGRDGASVARHETISGSECIKRIRNALDPEQESRVLALVRSANDSPQDLALYNSRAHGYMPKVPLRGISVREMVAPLWERRFPPDKRPEKQGDGDTDSDSSLSRIASIENLRDLTLISPMELLAELEQIDALCVRHRENTHRDRWCVLWDKLHQLKGDLKSVNVDDKFSPTIDLIEALRGDNHPANFMPMWLRIRSDVVSFISQH